jgi:outer membrane lipoprotein-sorting protein
VINEDTIDVGRIVVRRGKGRDIRYFTEIQPPNPMKALIAGGKAQIYYPKRNAMEVYELGKYKGLVSQYLLLGFGSNSRELQNAYTIRPGGSDLVAGQKTTRIELIPKSAEAAANLRKVELWIADDSANPGIVVQQKFYQPGQDYTLVTYSNMKVNPPIPDSAMKLDVPQGVQIQHPQ